MFMPEDTLGFFERFAHPAKRVTVHQKYARFVSSGCGCTVPQGCCHRPDCGIEEWAVLCRLNDKRKHLDPGTTYLVVIQVELSRRLAAYGRKVLDNKIHVIFELVWTCFWGSGRFVEQVR
jgi:hypothetical protein